MGKKTTVRDVLEALHNLPLDGEIRIKKDDQYVDNCLMVLVEEKTLRALFG